MRDEAIEAAAQGGFVDVELARELGQGALVQIPGREEEAVFGGEFAEGLVDGGGETDAPISPTAARPRFELGYDEPAGRAQRVVFGQHAAAPHAEPVPTRSARLSDAVGVRLDQEPSRILVAAARSRSTESLRGASGRSSPLEAPHQLVCPPSDSGHGSTVDLEETVGAGLRSATDSGLILVSLGDLYG